MIGLTLFVGVVIANYMENKVNYMILFYYRIITNYNNNNIMIFSLFDCSCLDDSVYLCIYLPHLSLS